MQIVEVDDAGMNISGKNEPLAITDGGKSASKKRKNEEAVKAKTNGTEKSAAKDGDVAMGEGSEDEDGFPKLGKKGGPVIIQTPKKKQAVSGYSIYQSYFSYPPLHVKCFASHSWRPAFYRMVGSYSSGI